MTQKLQIIGLDADDTLWQNEEFYRVTQARFAELLSDCCPEDDLQARLLEAERRNIGHYGFGIKGFMLSMIETALEVTEGKVSGAVIAEILAAGQDMLQHPITLLPHAERVVRDLSQAHKLVLITKGDLLDQERKLAQSGLGDYFHGVEIVSDKRPEIYTRAFQRHGAAADHALMAGNSMKSDVIPALEVGAFGVYIPSAYIWALEAAEAPETHSRYHRLPDLGGLPELVAMIENR
ncbi:HAD family hydrolase [Rhodobacteraceae bacterium XHP0102]|nr:HAD family hydrolase [Rhodobacteraceae bacterium XHP0102]